MLAVQIIEILWTKATRGAPRANERAALLRAYPFPGECAEYSLQQLRLAEWKNAFAPELVQLVRKRSVPSSEGVLRIQSQPNGSFKLGFLGTPNSGQPKRRAISEAFTLSADQHARLLVNARHTTHSGQYYSETIYNVACGINVAPDRFLLSKPEHELDLRDHLF